MKKESESCQFKANPEKAEARLHINSFLMGGLLTVLTLILTLDPERFSILIIAQLALAIPLILFASLSYAKMGYAARSHQIWDNFGWGTTNLGYLFFLNATGLILSAFNFKILTLIYFGALIFLSCAYYLLNLISQKGTFREHILKLIFFLIIIFFGGVLPLL